MAQSPAPKVKVIDFARNADRDRFARPRASFCKAGTLHLGITDRPSRRVMRWDFEAAKQHQNEVVEARIHSVPGGQRHNAYYAYLNARRVAEVANGYDAAWDRAAERCRRTQRPPHLASSRDNFLVWKADNRPSTPSPTARSTEAVEQARPSTAPAATSPSPSPAGWNMWSSAPFAPSSPRFYARAAFEYKRCSTPDTDDIKKATYAKIAAQRSAEKAAQTEREMRLALEWPHGMPAGARRQAEGGCAPVPAPLNYGSPLSMPQRQYEALRAGMRWY